MDDLRVDDAVLLYRLGDERLSASKSGPLRFLIPNVDCCAIGGVDACANVEFLGRIELTYAADLDTHPSAVRAHDALHERERSKA